MIAFFIRASLSWLIVKIEMILLIEFVNEVVGIIFALNPGTVVPEILLY